MQSLWATLKVTTLKLLIDNKAEINCKEIYGWTPLHYAAYQGHIDFMKLLIEKGADLNIQNKLMETALVAITFSKNASDKLKEEGIEILIRAGADLNLKDNEAPIDYEMVQQLRRQKPDLFNARK